MSRLKKKTPRVPASVGETNIQPESQDTNDQRVLNGQERLATKVEREDMKKMIDHAHANPSAKETSLESPANPTNEKP